MPRTENMPMGIHSDIPMEAVGEALLQHYNVGIKNPWYSIGRSDQETYNRRKLPWSDNKYEVGPNGTVSGPNADQLHPALKAQWAEFARVASEVNEGEGAYGDLETLYQERLTVIGDRLSNG